MHADNTIRTGVDDFIELLKKKGKISFQDAAQYMGLSIEVIQNWVDFLVEEEIVGVEYKLITPYVYIIKHNTDQQTVDTYEEFVQKARERNISEDMVDVLWKKYVIEHKATLQETFFKKAMDRGIEQKKVEQLWDQYYAKLVEVR